MEDEVVEWEKLHSPREQAAGEVKPGRSAAAIQFPAPFCLVRSRLVIERRVC